MITRAKANCLYGCSIDSAFVIAVAASLNNGKKMNKNVNVTPESGVTLTFLIHNF
jgi:hypothetical protein